MEDTEGDIFEEGDFEVVDECLDEEDEKADVTATSKNKDQDQDPSQMTKEGLQSQESEKMDETPSKPSDDDVIVEKKPENDSNSTGVVNTDVDTIADTDTNTNANADTNTNANTDTDTNTNANTDTNTNTNANTDTNTNTNAGTDTDLNGHDAATADTDAPVTLEEGREHQEEDSDKNKSTVTEEDVMQHLDEMENIIVNTSTFKPEVEAETEMETETQKVEESQELESAPENPPEKVDPPVDVPVPSDAPVAASSPSQEAEISKPKEGSGEDVEKVVEDKTSSEVKDSEDKAREREQEQGRWYEDKISTKVSTVKERLSKLARVLESSYPCYKKWLERSEALHGTAVCKLDPPRRCSLEKPHTNRWKFMCSRKPPQESTVKRKDEIVDSVVNNREVDHPNDECWSVDIDNATEYPSFVLRAVKIFEDFIRTAGQLPPDGTGEQGMDLEEPPSESKLHWLWLLVRCNRNDELMLFATGKNISSTVMERLKTVFESGPGKDCNVKSLYCKSINKVDNLTTSNTTFLVGTEALDEVVNGIKIQLAPKTNFWSNAAGAESLGNVVAEFLEPTAKTTVVEIGCGIGLIGLMLASRCQKVIGLDSPSEVEEAEMTAELNGIKNASFVMGQPSEVMTTIGKVLANSKASAVINANTMIGREVEIMTELRKIVALRRLVMVTTLTKQSVRAILELTRPATEAHGNPFMPLRACVVDTLPVGPHFEVVILMERRMMSKIIQPWIPKALQHPQQQHHPQGNASSLPAQKSTKGCVQVESDGEVVILGNISSSPGGAASHSSSTSSKKDKFVRKEDKGGVAFPRGGPPGRVEKKDLVKNIAHFKKTSGPGNLVIPKKQPSLPPIPKKTEPFHFGNPKFPPRGSVPPPNLKRLDQTKRFRGGGRTRPPRKQGFKETMFGNRKREWQPRVQHEGNLGGGRPIQQHQQLEQLEPELPIPQQHPLVNKDPPDLRERLSSSRGGGGGGGGGSSGGGVGGGGNPEPEVLKRLEKIIKLSSNSSNPVLTKELREMYNILEEKTSVWDRIEPPKNQNQEPKPSIFEGRFVQETCTEDIVITATNREFVNIPKGTPSKYNIPPLSPNLLVPVGSVAGGGKDFARNKVAVANPQIGAVTASWNQRERERERERERDRERSRTTERWERNQPLSPRRGSPVRLRNAPSPRMSSSSMANPSFKNVPLSPMRRSSPPPPSSSSSSYLKRQMSPQGFERSLSPPPSSRRRLSPEKRDSSPPPNSGRRNRRDFSPPRRGPQHMMQPGSGGIGCAAPLSPIRNIPSSPPRMFDDEWDIPSRRAIENFGNQNQNQNQNQMRNWEEQQQQQQQQQRNLNSMQSWNERFRNMPGSNSTPNSVMENWNEHAMQAGGSGGSWQQGGGGISSDWSSRKSKDLQPSFPWMEKQRWEQQQQQQQQQMMNDKQDDWNDLPEDAKDPWGDDGNLGLKDRWKYDLNESNNGGGWKSNNPNANLGLGGGSSMMRNPNSNPNPNLNLNQNQNQSSSNQNSVMASWMQKLSQQQQQQLGNLMANEPRNWMTSSMSNNDLQLQKRFLSNLQQQQQQQNSNTNSNNVGSGGSGSGNVLLPTPNWQNSGNSGGGFQMNNPYQMQRGFMGNNNRR